MIKLVAVALILSGFVEILGLLRVQTSYSRLSMSLVDFNALPEERKMELALSVLGHTAAEAFEIVAVVLGIVYFEGPLRWLLLSIFGLSILAAFLYTILPKSLYILWKYVDNTYCACVLILGPLLLLK